MTNTRDLTFLPAALEVLERPPSPLGRGLVLALCALVIGGIGWASVASLDVVATGTGRIIPAGKVKLIQPADAGVVKAIRVVEGQRVKAGEVLMELDPTSVEADLAGLSRDYLQAQLDVARLTALLTRPEDPESAFTVPPGADVSYLPQQRALMQARAAEQVARFAAGDADLAKRQAELQSIQAQIAKLNATIPLVRKRAETRRYLADKQIGSEITALEIQQQLVEQERELTVQQSRLVEAQATLTATRQARAQIRAEVERTLQTERAEAEKRRAALHQELIKAEQRRQFRTITAPVDGTIQQLAVTTVGGVVTAAQALMVLVPADAGLEVQANLLNRDIGFVHPGQRAVVKVETFTFTRYGYLEATVESVSRDAIDDPRQGLIYQARLKLDKTSMPIDGREVPLSAGMAVTTEIKTAERTVLDYLLAPLQKYKQEALRER